MTRAKNFPKEIEEFARLHNLSLGIGSSLTLNDALRTLYQESSQLLGTNNFAIALYNKSTDMLEFVLTFNSGKEVEPFRSESFYEQGLAQQVLTTRNPLLIRDLSKTNKIFIETMYISPDKPIRAWLGVPIPNPIQMRESAQYAQGLIIAWEYEPYAFKSGDLWLMWVVASQCAVAIRYVQLFESLHQRAMEIAIINDVAHILGATLNLDEVLSRMMEQVEGLLDAEVGALFLKDEESQDFVLQSSFGLKTVKPFAITKGEGIISQVAETGKPILIASIEPQSTIFRELMQQFQIPPRTILSVPLKSRERVIGVLELLNKKEADFVRHDLELLGAVASYAALAIENARLHESVLTERDRVIDAEDKARRLLARNLHDGPTQLVSDMIMRLEFCQQAIEKKPSLVPDEIKQMRQIAAQTLHQMRTMLFALHPVILETEGLVAAIEMLIERRQKDAKKTKLILKKQTPLSSQDNKVEAAIFAIVQEALTNAIKHAQASKIFVTMKETPTDVIVSVVDDGKGFEVSKVTTKSSKQASLGMFNIQERAELIGGKLTINSIPGKGSQILLNLSKEGIKRLKKR